MASCHSLSPIYSPSLLLAGRAIPHRPLKTSLSKNPALRQKTRSHIVDHRVNQIDGYQPTKGAQEMGSRDFGIPFSRQVLAHPSTAPRINLTPEKSPQESLAQPYDRKPLLVASFAAHPE